MENNTTFSSNIKNLINKVKKIINILRYSPVKNDILTKKIIGLGLSKYPLSVKTFSKTRWNSLLDCLERFYQIFQAIKTSLK